MAAKRIGQALAICLAAGGMAVFVWSYTRQATVTAVAPAPVRTPQGVSGPETGVYWRGWSLNSGVPQTAESAEGLSTMTLIPTGKSTGPFPRFVAQQFFTWNLPETSDTMTVAHIPPRVMHDARTGYAGVSSANPPPRPPMRGLNDPSIVAFDRPHNPQDLSGFQLGVAPIHTLDRLWKHGPERTILMGSSKYTMIYRPLSLNDEGRRTPTGLLGLDRRDWRSAVSRELRSTLRPLLIDASKSDAPQN